MSQSTDPTDPSALQLLVVAATYLPVKLSHPTLTRLARTGRIPGCVRVANRWFVAPADLVSALVKS